MKKTINIITVILLSITVFGLSSCLKDSKFVDFSKVGALVELPLEAFNGPGKLVSSAFPIQTTPQTLDLVVNLASPKPLGSNLTVTLGIDQAALTAYNHANGLDTGENAAPYTLPPANAVSIPNLKVTIPAGQRTVNLAIQIISSNLDPAGLYILPISITDGGGQKISNYSTILFNIQAKNKYDGQYVATGSFVDGASATITDAGVYPEQIYLVTQGANSVAFEDINFGFFHAINGGGVYGAFCPVFNFDPATNKITSVINFYGQPDPSRLRAARIDVSGVNALTGTPGTAGSVIQVKYVMTQAGADRTFFDETYTYKGVRP